nr:sulfatase [uncultured Dyadobacter sp.]
MNIRRLTFLHGIVAMLLITSFATAQKAKSPNIIVILADDLGYGDLASYGHPTIRTPYLDRMATEGMRFTQFYSSSAVCTPARAGLLTGRLPARTGVYGKGDVFRQNSASGLPLKEITIAEMLKMKGYATGLVGKWHLGHLQEFLPTRQGFDYWFGVPYSNDMGKVFSTHKDGAYNIPPGPRANAPTLPLYRNETIIEEEPDQHFLTKRYTEEVVNFIKKSKDKPFFMYYASNFPHTPLYASPQFEGKSKRGLYGDVVAELDWSVGQILQTLKELKLDQNTLVIFTSDNGPWLPMKDHAGSAGLLYEGKNSTYEGGIRVPGIAWWPGKIKANVVSEALISALDIFPTASTLAGVSLDKNLVLDGIDQTGVLTGRQDKAREMLPYYINENVFAVRKGAWKAHFVTHASYSPVAPETHTVPLLYNIENDPSEKYDLAKQNPEIVAELTAEFEKQKKAFPIPPSEIEKVLPAAKSGSN